MISIATMKILPYRGDWPSRRSALEGNFKGTTLSHIPPHVSLVSRYYEEGYTFIDPSVAYVLEADGLGGKGVLIVESGQREKGKMLDGSSVRQVAGWLSGFLLGVECSVFVLLLTGNRIKYCQRRRL